MSPVTSRSPQNANDGPPLAPTAPVACGNGSPSWTACTSVMTPRMKSTSRVAPLAALATLPVTTRASTVASTSTSPYQNQNAMKKAFLITTIREIKSVPPNIRRSLSSPKTSGFSSIISLICISSLSLFSTYVFFFTYRPSYIYFDVGKTNHQPSLGGKNNRFLRFSVQIIPVLTPFP